MTPNIVSRLLPLLALALLLLPVAAAVPWPTEGDDGYDEPREPTNSLFFLPSMVGLWPAVLFFLGLIGLLIWQRKRRRSGA